MEYGHEESVAHLGHDPRVYAISAESFFAGPDGKVAGVRTLDVTFHGGRLRKIPGSQREWSADLVLLSMGFVGPEHAPAEPLGIEYDEHSNYAAEFGSYATNVDGVFAAGDCRRGQSLVVWAIREGREAAREIDRWLMGETRLP